MVTGADQKTARLLSAGMVARSADWRADLPWIRAAGREPIERDTLYRPVTRTETSVMVAV